MFFLTGRHLSVLAAGVLLAGCSGGDGAEAPLALLVDPTPLPDATVGQPYDHVTSVSGGTPPYSLEVTQGSLPSGLSLTSSGSWTGTPSIQGTYTMTVTATDSSAPPRTGTRDVDLFVWSSSGPLTLWTSSLPGAALNTAYTGHILVSGGTLPYQYHITDGSLPPGLSFDEQTGSISGTPTTTGIFPVTFTVGDATVGGTTLEAPLSIPVTSGFVAPNTHFPSLEVSRTSGVAPLSVFFDATNYAVSGVTKPFHELYFHWEFADPQSRHRLATGGVAAHVFELPGSYPVRLTVQAPDGSTHCLEQTITVQDPSSVFSGSNTICFSNDGTFTGAPSGATHITTNSFDTALGYIANGKRLLFQRGHSFTSTNPPVVTVTANASIGAFGAGVNPDARGIYANNPTIVAATETCCPIRANDLRIADLRFVEASGYQSAQAVGPGHRSTDILLYRITTEGFTTAAGFPHDLIDLDQVQPYEAVTMAQCHFKDARVNTIYVGGKRFALVGNWFDRCLTSHIIRITFANQCAVDGNLIEYPGGTRHCLKLHAAVGTPSLYGLYSEKVVIRDNVMRATTPWAATIGSQDNITDERVREVVFEKNTMIAENGVQVDLYLHCQDTTVRNNLFLADHNTFYDPAAILIDEPGISPSPRGIEVYNNTYYNNTPGNTEESLLLVNRHTGLVRVENNIVYAPTSIARVVAPGGASLVAAQANLVNQSFAFVDPGNLIFTPGPGSAALGVGVTTPARDDFRGMPRLFNDVGAFGR